MFAKLTAHYKAKYKAQQEILEAYDQIVARYGDRSLRIWSILCGLTFGTSLAVMFCGLFSALFNNALWPLEWNPLLFGLLHVSVLAFAVLLGLSMQMLLMVERRRSEAWFRMKARAEADGVTMPNLE